MEMIEIGTELNFPVIVVKPREEVTTSRSDFSPSRHSAIFQARLESPTVITRFATKGLRTDPACDPTFARLDTDVVDSTLLINWEIGAADVGG